ncbi:MAG: hypothetical protein KF678_03550 [Phycisphaeraceae bacterium]|nr:hypothetical protein [Phycisphaeraceae bacterium]
MALTLEAIKAKVEKAEAAKAKAIEKAEAVAKEELSALGEELSAQHIAAIEAVRNIERMLSAAGIGFRSAFGGKVRASGKGGTGRTRGTGADSVKGRTLLYLSGKSEASVDDIAAALKLDDGQKKGLGVSLSTAKKAGLLDAGSGRGLWKITAKGKEAIKAMKTPD